MIDFDIDSKLNTILENSDLLSVEEKIEIAILYNKIEAEKEKKKATEKNDMVTAEIYNLHIKSLNEKYRYESLYESLWQYMKSRNLADLQVTPSALIGFIQMDKLNAQRNVNQTQTVVKTLQKQKEQG